MRLSRYLKKIGLVLSPFQCLVLGPPRVTVLILTLSVDPQVHRNRCLCDGAEPTRHASCQSLNYLEKMNPMRRWVRIPALDVHIVEVT
jgi:hypothetical protein